MKLPGVLAASYLSSETLLRVETCSCMRELEEKTQKRRQDDGTQEVTSLQPAANKKSATLGGAL